MNRENVGTIGIQLPWKQMVGIGMLVDSFSVFATIKDGRVKGLGGGMPKAVARVELFLTAQSIRDEVGGADSMFALLPVEHADDVIVLHWVFEERRVGDGEEVMVTYLPAGGLFGGSKASLLVAISSKGTLRNTFETVQRGEPEPDTEPIWTHAPRTPFVKAST